MNHFAKKLLSLGLILVLLFTLSGSTSYPLNDELPLSALRPSEAPAIGLERVVDLTKHVKRLAKEETDEYSAIFLNTDGSKTMYLFASPIKYRSSDGTLHDKNAKFVSCDAGIGMFENDAQLIFDSESLQSVTMKYQDHLVSFDPCSLKKGTVGQMSGECIRFDKGLENDGTLLYEPLLSGISQVLLFENTSQLNDYKQQN